MRFPNRAGFVILTLILAAAGLMGVSQLAQAAPTQVATRRISLSSSGAQANGASSLPSISADGRYVAFASLATNLIPNDTNGVQDVFVHDCLTGATRRVSLSSAGEQGNAASYNPVISPDGRYVAFVSDATNLVSVDTNFSSDIFLHDLQTGQTRRVSIASNGVQPNDHSIAPAISAGGRYVAFQSYAGNLVSGDTNQSSDIFLHDLQTGQTSRVSLGVGGVQGNGSSMLPGLSADGRGLVFRSTAWNLVSQDSNDAADIFVRWLDSGAIRRVSLSSSGVQANGDSNAPVISNDGRHVAFISEADNLVSGDTNDVADVFHHDLHTGQTQRLSLSSDGVHANDGVDPRLSISGDGRFVAFASWADNLANGDTNTYADVFIHDRWSGLTERLSLDSNNQQANHESYHPSLSADGRYAVFDSFASNLISGDTNSVADIFLRDRGEQSQPTLSANPAVGAPGSFFNMEGVNFPRQSLVSLSVNGSPLTLTLNVDSSGYFSFTLDSTLAEPGVYLVRASANPSALAYVILDPNAALLPPQGDAPIAILPPDIGYTLIRYLPLVYR